MPDLLGAVAGVVAELVAGGVRASADLRDVNPPAVVVREPALAWRFKSGDWDATWTAHAVVPDNGAAGGLAALGELLGQAQAALAGRIAAARPVLLQMPDGADLPAYELTWADRIRET